jgi:hypothetical protein
MAPIKKSFLFTSLFIFTVCFGFNSNAQELVTNGDFEAGNLTGWTTAANPGDGSGCGFFRYSGTKSFNDNSIEAPPLGNYAVSSDTLDPPCSSAIYQDIAVPSGAEVSCFLIYYYKNFGDDFVIGPGLDSSDLGTPNQQARIDIMTQGAGAFATGSAVLKNLVQTEPGDPNTLNYTTLNFDLSEYAGTTVKLRAAQANNQGVILFAIDGVTCTVDNIGIGDEISSVPALSEWGLIAMSLALGIAGFIIIRRRLTASNY